MSDQQQSADSKKTNKTPYDANRIRALRERLYARTGREEYVPRHSVTAREPTTEAGVRTSVPQPVMPQPRPQPQPVPRIEVEPASSITADMTKRRTSYRTKFIFGGILFFVLALLVSAGMFFFGGNSVSGDNITVTTSGPVQVGGGEPFPFKVTIANQNQVPIQGVNLIVEYPKGTQSTAEGGKELSVERRALDSIAAGEVVNVELSARMYGEENTEQEIHVRVEYRVDGSNATFEKNADILRFKIGTSPIVLTFDTVSAVSSGQEVKLNLTVQLNAPAPIDNLLVKATYPEGFDFSTAEPATVSGEDVWRIPHIAPGEKKQITIRGILTGHETETRQFTASAGMADDTNSFALSSQLAGTQTVITLEKTFLDLGVTINGNSDDMVVISKGEQATVNIELTNTLDTTVYNGEVVVTLHGNALDKFNINPYGGFYDSSQNTITWISAQEDSLKEVLPGNTKKLTFALSPKDSVGTGVELAFSVDAKGQRIFDSKPTEEIQGTAERSIRIEGVLSLAGESRHNTGSFTNAGPVPPVAESTTQYTITLHATAGSNDVTDTEVSATLPQYVNWLDAVSEGAHVSFNSVTRTITWTVEDIKSGESADVSMQVSVKPSTSQVGEILTLLGTQRLKATDRFTGTVVRAQSPALTTRLVGGVGETDQDGRVQPKP